MGIVVSDFSRCVPVSECETGWGISGHSGDVGFGSPCLTFPSAGSEESLLYQVVRRKARLLIIIYLYSGARDPLPQDRMSIVVGTVICRERAEACYGWSLDSLNVSVRGPDADPIA